jgi:glycosyltransferase involved in cell wall biosynthesis
VSAALFSILTPVYDTPPACLDACIDSVLAQSFTDWEWVLVDDASPNPVVGEILARAAARDPRLKVRTRAENGGIVAASSDALAAATGTFVTFLDHDDLLDSEALAVMARTVHADPLIDVAYSDEDKIEATGHRRYDAFLKPDWSPARLRSQMFLGHLTVMRRSLVVEVGGFRADFEGSQDYDLALRVTEKAREIAHVPQVLYHWRALPASAASGAEAKPYAYDAAKRALEEHCARIGIPASVEQVHPTGVYRVRPVVESPPLVSIIIPTRGSAAIIHGHFRTLVTGAVRSIVDITTYPNYEVVVVADATMPTAVAKELQELLGDRLRLVSFERPFSFSDKVNCGALEATGDFLLFLNDDVHLLTADWIEALLGPCADPDVGMVGAMLYFEDGTIQHAGHSYALGEAGHIGLKEPGGQTGYFSAYLVERETVGVTAACAIVPKQVFHDVGGFTMHLPGNFNDVDFSLKIRALGYRVVWTPHAELFHFESKTRVTNVGAEEVSFMHRRWRHRMERDPYWPTPPK